MRPQGLLRPASERLTLVPKEGDPEFAKNRRRFTEELDRTIHEANREVMSSLLHELDREAFLRLAVQVATLRGEYIKAGLALGTGDPNAASIEALAERRTAYEETLKVFEAAERIVERGYIELAS